MAATWNKKTTLKFKWITEVQEHKMKCHSSGLCKDWDLSPQNTNNVEYKHYNIKID